MIYEDSITPLKARTYVFDEFRLEAENLLLLRNSGVVPLAPKACEVLISLIESNGNLITKQEILDKVWKDTFVEEANLAHHISALRKALGEDKNGKKFIETIPRRGYRFVAEVKNAADSESTEIVVTERTHIQVVEESTFEADNLAVVKDISTTEKSSTPKIVWALAATLAVLLLGTTAFLAYRNFSSPKLSAQKEISFKRLTPDAYAMAPSVSPDGTSIVFSSVENGRETLWRKQIQTGEMTQLLSTVSTTDGKIEFTRFSPEGKWIYYSRGGEQNMLRNVFRISINGGNPQKIVSDVQSDFSISPDGKQIAYTFDFRQLIIFDVETGAKRVVYERDGMNQMLHSLQFNSVGWSPDGSRLVLFGAVFQDSRYVKQLIEFNLQSGAMNLIPLPEDFGIVFQIEWQPDGSGLFITREKGSGLPSEIWHVAYPSGTASRISKEGDSFDVIRLSADGKNLVAEQQLGGFNIWTAPIDNLAAKRQITIGASARQGSRGATFTLDGKIIYSSTESGMVDLWMMDEDGGNRKQLTVNVGKSNVNPQMTSDGRYIVFSSSRSGTNQVWRMDADGRNPVQLSTGIENFEFNMLPDDTVCYITFLQDEQKYQIYRIPVSGGTPEKVEDGFNYQLFAPIFSPDGNRTLAFGNTSKDEPPYFALIDRATNKVRKFPKISGTSAKWSPDSKAILYKSDDNQQLWRRSIDGGEAQQIANFYPLAISNFNTSPDGKQMIFSLANVTSEIVQIQNFNESEEQTK